MDLDKVIDFTKATIPLSFFFLIMHQLFPEHIGNLVSYLLKIGMGLLVFMMTWEVGKSVKK